MGGLQLNSRRIKFNSCEVIQYTQNHLGTVFSQKSTFKQPNTWLNMAKIGKLQTKIPIFTRVLESKYSDSYSIFRFQQYSVLVLVLDFDKCRITRYSFSTRFLRFPKVLELSKSTRFEYLVLARSFPVQNEMKIKTVIQKYFKCLFTIGITFRVNLIPRDKNIDILYQLRP